ncbi:MAG: hypothetical protein ACR5KX_04385 [Wolbachia sp.]
MSISLWVQTDGFIPTREVGSDVLMAKWQIIKENALILLSHCGNKRWCF